MASAPGSGPRPASLNVALEEGGGGGRSSLWLPRSYAQLSKPSVRRSARSWRQKTESEEVLQPGSEGADPEPESCRRTRHDDLDPALDPDPDPQHQPSTLTTVSRVTGQCWAHQDSGRWGQSSFSLVQIPQSQSCPSPSPVPVLSQSLQVTDGT